MGIIKVKKVYEVRKSTRRDPWKCRKARGASRWLKGSIAGDEGGEVSGFGSIKHTLSKHDRKIRSRLKWKEQRRSTSKDQGGARVIQS